MLEHTLTSLIHLHYVKQTAPLKRLIPLLACGGAALKMTEEEDRKPLSAAGECSATWPTHMFLGSLLSCFFFTLRQDISCPFTPLQTGPGENSSFNTKTIFSVFIINLIRSFMSIAGLQISFSSASGLHRGISLLPFLLWGWEIIQVICNHFHSTVPK